MSMDSITDVLVLLVLVLFVFGDYFLGSSMMQTRKLYKSWFKEYKDKVWLPPRWLFPFMWFILYVLIVISFYIFYTNVYNGEPSYVVPTITLLFLFNIIANKLWSPTFIEARMTGLALFLCIVIVATGIAILVIFGINASYVTWAPFGTFIPYVLWCLFALYLNSSILYVEMNDKKCKV